MKTAKFRYCYPEAGGFPTVVVGFLKYVGSTHRGASWLVIYPQFFLKLIQFSLEEFLFFSLGMKLFP